jgi:hypothetical protein
LREADQHSRQLVSSAEQNAGQIVAQAKAHGDQLLTGTNNEIGRLQAAAQRELGELAKQKECISSYLAQIRQLLSTQLSPPGEPPANDCLAGSGVLARRPAGRQVRRSARKALISAPRGPGTPGRGTERTLY